MIGTMSLRSMVGLVTQATGRTELEDGLRHGNMCGHVRGVGKENTICLQGFLVHLEVPWYSFPLLLGGPSSNAVSHVTLPTTG